MSNHFNFKYNSFTAKVLTSLFILALILISILLALIIPKMEKAEYKKKINEIEKILSITQEQIKLSGTAIEIQSILETKLIKKNIENELSILENKINTKKLKFNQIQNELEKKKYIYIIKDSNNYFDNTKDTYKKHISKNYNIWEEHETNILDRSYSHKIKYYSFSKKVSDIEITIFCTEDDLNPNHAKFEEKIKKHVQKTFQETTNLHKGKTYLFWLNSKYLNDDSEILYEKDNYRKNEKYTISKVSNVSNIFTGDLTPKKIMDASKNGFVEHNLNNKKAISWIKDIYADQYENYTLLLVKTIYKNDLNESIDSSLVKILPAAFISLVLAFCIAFFIFKRLFKTINTLTNTAKEVNNGNKQIRSNIKGNDDIGNLGIAFDNMLDFFEHNVKLLDIKVKEKTKELQESLFEKETLLKEIHHRVKNNLALTISLIKLQEDKIKDIYAQKVLNDIQERIYIMELLHRKLYESKNLNSINFKEYVSMLTHDIAYTYNYEHKIEIFINMEEIFLDVDFAMPCGLILNELVTNSFKYAFIDNKKPRLEISMKKNKKNYILTVKDNGKGLKEKDKLDSSDSLGLKLVNKISKFQLEGKIEYYYDNGAIFKIEF